MSPASRIGSEIGNLILGHDRRSSAVSSKSSNPSPGLWSPKVLSNDISSQSSACANSEKSGDSKSSSHASSAEHAPSVLDHSDSDVDESISHAVADVVSCSPSRGVLFEYAEVTRTELEFATLRSHQISCLEAIPSHILANEYSLPDPILSILASDPDRGVSHYMTFTYGKLYFWTPGSDELLYVNEIYSKKGILARIDTDFSGLRTKILKPLHQHLPPVQLFWPSLWFWQVSKGWSQNIFRLDDIQEIVQGCYDYGLPLSVSLLERRNGSIKFLLKSGEKCYLYYGISHDLVRIDEPTSLHEILRTISTKYNECLKTTLIEP